MKWYMTVGYPGGEFAMQRRDDDIDLFRRRFSAMVHLLADALGVETLRLRPCPPDLVEWIEAHVGNCVWKPRADGRWYVSPGGWVRDIHHGEGRWATAFIPVAGAAGLTIISESDAPPQ